MGTEVNAWVELRLVLDRTRFPLASQAAFEAGALGVEEAPAPGEVPAFRQPWDTHEPPASPTCTLKAWFTPEQAPLAHATLAAWGEVARARIHETDWADAWRQHHHPVVVSDRLTVSPPWTAQAGDLVIPPGNAFGTGDHATTFACLRAIEELSSEAASCLDVGCGSGVLALAAARAGLTAHGVDIDPDSVRAARANALLNGLDATFDERALGSLQPADLVVANLYAEVLTDMAPQLRRLTRKHLALAGILADRAQALIAALAPMRVVVREQDGEWVHLRLVPA